MTSSANKAVPSRDQSDLGSLLRCGASVIAFCAFAAAAPAFAQAAQGTGQRTGAPGTGTQQNQPENADLDNTPAGGRPAAPEAACERGASIEGR